MMLWEFLPTFQWPLESTLAFLLLQLIGNKDLMCLSWWWQ